MNEFVIEHQDLFLNWYSNSNYIVLLSVKDKSELISLLKKLPGNIRYSIFKEPDLNNEITAIVLEDSYLSKKICKNLSLFK